MELLDHPTGDYRFLTGIAPYSAGVIARPGFEIVHVTLASPLTWREGFALIERYLAGVDRPASALCAMSLRAPAPFSFEGFAAFNAAYQERLARLEVYVDGRNPVARTHVAPLHAPPPEPSLYGFAYTTAATDTTGGATFVVAGAGDLADQADLRSEAIVRRGETGADAMAQKAATVMSCMAARLHGLGVAPADVAVTNVYCVHPIHELLESPIFSTLGRAAIHGVHWHPAHPPIEGLAFEMDLRGVRQECWLR